MRIALVHDYLAQDGGAERVLRAMHELWPQAPVFVLFHDRERANPAFLGWKDIRTTFLNRLPFAAQHFRWTLPFMPWATETHDLRGFDVVLSSSSMFAKGVLVQPGTLHLSYCHTPARFLWTDRLAYAQDNVPRLVRPLLPPLLTQLRQWDRLSADRVDAFIANSRTVADRIWTYYRRQADVLHPPVDTHLFSAGQGTGGYFLTGGRLVAYKRFDIAVRACAKLGVKLVVFGEGPELNRLRALANKHITFVGRVNDTTRAELYKNALAFVHPQVEDFGITALEAQASGRPVIAYPAGGATETVISGVTGMFFEEQTWENLAHALLRFDPSRFSPEAIRRHALQFDTALFSERLLASVTSRFGAFRSGQRDWH